MSSAGNLWRRIHGAVTKRPTNFSWVIDSLLAGSGMPTSAEEIGWVREKGIKAIVTVNDDPLPERWLDGVDYLYVPAVDHGAPDIEGIERAVDFLHEHIERKTPTMVHCAAGRGRTGTILAAYLIKFMGMDVVGAIERIRSLRPGSIQSTSQEIALSTFQKYLKGRSA